MVMAGYQNKADRAYGKKLKKMEAKEGKLAKKRLKEFTSISPVGKKTKWYY
jgi:hypothetical protein